MKYLAVIFFVSLSGCSLPAKEESPFGPWHAFIYEQTAKYEQTRVYHGEYARLTYCMEALQVKTSYSGNAYFCGYNCPGLGIPNVSYTCEKVMGSPLTTLD
tara:strand:+ start:143780 stop:144082 length:303 start_codon:yes stop_codon:yes gene_type:complete